MNKRKLKKTLKKANNEALVNQNEYLKREHIKLKGRIAVMERREEVMAKSYEAHLGALTKLCGEKIEGYHVVKVPIEEIRTVLRDYEVRCSIEDGKYIICVLPKVDSEG